MCLRKDVKMPAKVLEENIEKSLHELNMEKSKFKVNIENDGTFYDNGMDKVEFLISTNPGEPLKHLLKLRRAVNCQE